MPLALLALAANFYVVRSRTFSWNWNSKGLYLCFFGAISLLRRGFSDCRSWSPVPLHEPRHQMARWPARSTGISTASGAHQHGATCKSCRWGRAGHARELGSHSSSQRFSLFFIASTVRKYRTKIQIKPQITKWICRWHICCSTLLIELCWAKCLQKINSSLTHQNTIILGRNTLFLTFAFSKCLQW